MKSNWESHWRSVRSKIPARTLNHYSALYPIARNAKALKITWRQQQSMLKWQLCRSWEINAKAHITLPLNFGTCACNMNLKQTNQTAYRRYREVWSLGAIEVVLLHILGVLVLICWRNSLFLGSRRFAVHLLLSFDCVIFSFAIRRQSPFSRHHHL